jgi:DNA (cytosine-5)-methyltransferase 1
MVSSVGILDLFAGVGGLSWGFHDLQLDGISLTVDLAVEENPIHMGTYSANYPSTKTLCADIFTVDGSWLKTKLDRKPTIIIGGPPCQAFSVQGRRDIYDPRVQLIFEFQRIVEEMDSPYFLMENVPGITQGKMILIFDALREAFDKAGYQTRWRVLKAADYGIPQSRQRLFLIGGKKGLPLPDFPAPLGRCPTVTDAIADLPVVDNYECLFRQDYLPYLCMATTCSAYAAKLRSHRLKFITGLRRTQHEPRIVEAYKSTACGKREPNTHCPRLHPDGISTTLLAGALKNRQTALRPIHPYYPRVLTVREGARLQSFPDSFRFASEMLPAWVQVGNAVPPLLSRAIALEFAKVLV